MSDRYIRLSRSFFNTPEWSEARVFSKAEAWLDLIALAADSDKTISVNGYDVEVAHGEIACTIRTLAVRWGWCKDKVARYLRHLSSADNACGNPRIKVATLNATACATRYTVITICNYDKYGKNNTNNATARATTDATAVRYCPTDSATTDATMSAAVTSCDKAVCKPADKPSATGVATSARQAATGGATRCDAVTAWDSDICKGGKRQGATSGATGQILSSSLSLPAPLFPPFISPLIPHNVTQTQSSYLTHTVRDKKERIVRGENNTDVRLKKEAAELLAFVDENYPQLQRMESPLTFEQAVWILRRYNAESARFIFAQMANKQVWRSNTSVYSTFTVYVKRDKTIIEHKSYTYAEMCDYITANGPRSAQDFCKAGGRRWVLIKRQDDGHRQADS